MSPSVFSVPTRIVFGPGALESVGGEAAAAGRHALLVTGTTFARRSGLMDSLHDSLQAAGVSVTRYDDLGPHPTTDAVDTGGEVARQSGADMVLGVGGGSTLDAAKAIAAAAAEGGKIWEFSELGEGRAPIARALPIVQVPIIASTGSEANDTAILFHPQTGLKAPIRSPFLQARAAIIDPILTFTVPPRFTAVGGMNIVSQMLETYLNGDEFAVADRITEGLIRVVMDSLPRAMRRGEDLEARTNLSWAAVMASTAAVAGRNELAPVRAMAHPLSAQFGVEHGLAVAALWPSYMRYALANRFRLPGVGRFKRYALLGRQIFGVHETDDEVAAETTAFRFVSWLRSMNMPTDLGQLGITELDSGLLAQQAVTAFGSGKRIPPGLAAHDVEHIYEGAFRPA